MIFRLRNALCIQRQQHQLGFRLRTCDRSSTTAICSRWKPCPAFISRVVRLGSPRDQERLWLLLPSSSGFLRENPKTLPLKMMTEADHPKPAVLFHPEGQCNTHTHEGCPQDATRQLSSVGYSCLLSCGSNRFQHHGGASVFPKFFPRNVHANSTLFAYPTTGAAVLSLTRAATATSCDVGHSKRETGSADSSSSRLQTHLDQSLLVGAACLGERLIIDAVFL